MRGYEKYEIYVSAFILRGKTLRPCRMISYLQKNYKNISNNTEIHSMSRTIYLFVIKNKFMPNGKFKLTGLFRSCNHKLVTSLCQSSISC